MSFARQVPSRAGRSEIVSSQSPDENLEPRSLRTRYSLRPGARWAIYLGVLLLLVAMLYGVLTWGVVDVVASGCRYVRDVIRREYIVTLHTDIERAMEADGRP